MQVLRWRNESNRPISDTGAFPASMSLVGRQAAGARSLGSAHYLDRPLIKIGVDYWSAATGSLDKATMQTMSMTSNSLCITMPDGPWVPFSRASTSRAVLIGTRVRARLERPPETSDTVFLLQ